MLPLNCEVDVGKDRAEVLNIPGLIISNPLLQEPAAGVHVL